MIQLYSQFAFFTKTPFKISCLNVLMNLTSEIFICHCQLATLSKFYEYIQLSP